jgi:hypothetical protein
MKITMVGRLSDCLLLAYRTPLDAIAGLLPPGLSPVTHGGYAFWNVVACRVEKMRPAHIPRAFGMSYHHVAYRLYVRAATRGGEITGLYFLRSDADSSLISAGGNLTSDFRFHGSQISLTTDAQTFSTRVTSKDASGDADILATLANEARLAADSCFASIEEANHLLKYQPFGLSVHNKVLHVAEVLRDESCWRESAVTVGPSQFSYLDSLHQHNLRLERATRVDAIDYRWRLGRKELLL